MNLDDVPLPEPVLAMEIATYTPDMIRADRRAIAAMVAEECAKIAAEYREQDRAAFAADEIRARFGVKP